MESENAGIRPQFLRLVQALNAGTYLIRIPPLGIAADTGQEFKAFVLYKRKARPAGKRPGNSNKNQHK